MDSILPRPLTPIDTIRATLACATLAAISLALIIPISPLGEWIFTGTGNRLALAGFLIAAAVLAGMAAGIVLWLALASLDYLYRFINPAVIVVSAWAVILTWLALILARPSGMHVLEMPLFTGGIFLVALAARGDRPWRQWDAVIFAFSALCYFSAPWFVELLAFGDMVDMLVYVAPGNDLINHYVNMTIRLLTYGLVALGILAGRRLPTRSRTAKTKRPLAWAVCVLLAAVLIVPAYQTALHVGADTRHSDHNTERSAGTPTDPVTGTAQPAASPLNVVLISIDTLRADHLSIYGYEKNTSPNIDRFFANTAMFRHCYAQSPWTLPSHMSMITGQHISAHGVRIHPRLTRHYHVDALPESAVTLAEIFKAAGYATGGFTGGGFMEARFGFDQGFEKFHAADTSRMREVLDAALPWLDTVGNRPFFLFLHSYDVHHYDPQHTFDDLSDEGYDGQLRTAIRKHPRQIEWLVNKQKYHDLSAADIDFIRHLYDREIRGVDVQLQRLFDRLAHQGVLERTIVVLTADHGENFAEHGDLGHARNMYETVLRVPLLISAPAYRTGVQTETIAQTIDIAPTLLELTGLPVHSDMSGESLVPALGGETGNGKSIIVEADSLDTQAALILDGFKYVGYRFPVHNPLEPLFRKMSLTGLITYYREPEKLFDLHLDPGEVRNLASDDPERTTLYRDLLSTRIRELRAGVHGPTDDSGQPIPEDLRERLRALGYID